MWALNDPWGGRGAGVEKCSAERGPCTGMCGVGQRVGAQGTGRDNHPPAGKHRCRDVGAVVGARGGRTAGCEFGTLSWKESPDWGRLWNREEGVGLGPVPQLRSRAGRESGPRAAEAAGAQASCPSTLPPCLSRRGREGKGGEWQGTSLPRSCSDPGVALRTLTLGVLVPQQPPEGPGARAQPWGTVCSATLCPCSLRRLFGPQGSSTLAPT